MVQYLAASVENDRVMQSLFDALDHSLRPSPSPTSTQQSQTTSTSGSTAGAASVNQKQKPLQLDRAYGVQIAKYVFPWTRFAESARPFDESSALPPIELELSDGRKLTTSLLVRLFFLLSTFFDSFLRENLVLTSSARFASTSVVDRL